MGVEMEALSQTEAQAWTAGHVAGLRLAGIATNPYGASDLGDVWEDGYKTGRRDHGELRAHVYGPQGY
jgi:hypothetical protein